MPVPERAWLHRQCAVRSAGELRGRAGRDPARLRCHEHSPCPGSCCWSRGRLFAVLWSRVTRDLYAGAQASGSCLFPADWQTVQGTQSPPLSVRVKRKCTEAKKHCWYFEGLYPTYYICRSYEDCCGSRCCVRALSIQRLWYFWFLLMMGVLFCCGAGFFIRRRMYPPPLVEEPTFNVSYTRQPVNTASGSQQPGVPYYTDPGGPVMNPMAMAFHVQPNSPQGNPVYPPPPSYCNTPPPPYEQVVKSST
ncbi:vesicular, overexpressed in cancer, prosurvival protein 1 isoform X1 [Catharus ustulatus]|uniref:vesicular, overexpressed in cancer, prosurvival protein 1 isoform X1 n=1 Tax=Catharus ustulatus TaxID=91951 RepID=UPI00140E73D3|nr:vesicular, overexpressed in cancer, prosurvival protein 1 isoform X1 [Catharus ustulatus]